LKRVRIPRWSPSLSTDSWNVDPLVPAPTGLYQYIQALDSWVKGTPCEDPTIGGLITVCGFGDAARRDFSAGRGALWGLVPPIDALQIREVDLSPVGLRALTLPLTLRGRHALHHFAPEQTHGQPPILVDLEYLCGLALASLERGGDEPGSSARRRLEILLVALEARTNPGSLDNPENERMNIPMRKNKGVSPGVVSEQRDRLLDIAEPLTTEELIKKRSREARRRGSFRRAMVGVFLLPMLVALYFSLPMPGGGLASAGSYSSMPLFALVRLPGQIKVRVHASWFSLPDEERNIAMLVLWDELVDETEDGGLELTVADHVNETRGGVVAGKVWWRSR